jgi:hypothetical protein
MTEPPTRVNKPIHTRMLIRSHTWSFFSNPGGKKMYLSFIHFWLVSSSFVTESNLLSTHRFARAQLARDRCSPSQRPHSSSSLLVLRFINFHPPFTLLWFASVLVSSLRLCFSFVVRFSVLSLNSVLLEVLSK